MLDERVVEACIAAAADCDVFLAVGTSLQVWPAAGLADVAVGAGARLVVVNAEPTPTTTSPTSSSGSGSAPRCRAWWPPATDPGRRARRRRPAVSVTGTTTSGRRCRPRPSGAGMRVPLTTRDFLDRAELVYADRIGIVDEPDPAGAVAGRGELPRGRPPRPGAAGRARRARHRRGRAGRDRQPQLRPAARAAARGAVVGPGGRADQLPALAGGGQLHRRALRRPGAARRPGAGVLAQGRGGRAPVRHGGGVRAAAPLRHRAAAVGRSPTRTPPRRSTTPAGRRRGPRACR